MKLDTPYRLGFFALLLTASLLSPPSGWARQDKIYAETATIARIISVYDGDTFRCDLACYPPLVGENIGIRVNGIDTPEMKDRRPEVKALAIKARDYVRKWFEEAQTVELRNLRRGKYFRIVADVYVDGVSLAERLIELGYAHPYDGGTKQKW
ncbi:thermonuclease family protein [Pseudodesulfovibrio methanolicus]|uniref:Thermonuclease family protein n=1 Tax=Pseudodesulfovibrio methanolicus TaxID=3126690 RepID=A0ABZ2IVV3_9BACT